jgi:hypothetical protein
LTQLPDYASTPYGSQERSTVLDDTEMQPTFVNLRQAQAVMTSPVEGRTYSGNDKSRYCKSIFAWILARLHHHHLDALEAFSTECPLSSLCSYDRTIRLWYKTSLALQPSATCEP